MQIVKLDGVLGSAHKSVEEGKFVFVPWNKKRYNSATDIAYEFSEFEETTTEEKEEFIVKAFNWGKVLNLHKIGDIQIIEGESRGEDPMVSYYVYHNFDDTCNSCDSLDSAIILGLTIKYLGLNNRNLADGIERMLNMPRIQDTKL